LARRKVLLLGLDAAEYSLLLEGCDAGWLPTLKGLRDRGAWGAVHSPPGFGSGAVWPSFSTGVSPSVHGRYFYRQVFPGSYVARRFEAEDFRSAPFWEALSDAGRRVAVFDVPKVGLSEPLNGLMSVDWIVHGTVYHELRTSPPSLAAELVERFGSDPIPKCDTPGQRSVDENRKFVEQMIERIDQRKRCTLELMASEPWDLFLTVFGEPHCVGHQCWHIRDPAHPLHDAASAAALGDPLREVYTAIDRALGEIIAAVDEETVVIVFSGTGMGPNYTGNYILDDVLRRLEGLPRPRRVDWFTRTKLRVKKMLPKKIRKRGRPLSLRVEEVARKQDRASRLCFVVPHNDIAGAIRVNLVGREPEGRVHPGEEFEALYKSLRTDLLDLVNLDTGGRVVDDVVRTADGRPGPEIDRMPDFFVIWNRESPIDRVGSPRVGEVEYIHRGNRTGDHSPASLFIAAGPGVTSGRVPNTSILDLAPTVAHLLDVDLPDVEGHRIEALEVDPDH
jgi:predicted AlkP superfamily phosphohydrolase/phosphomutase